MGKPAYVKWVEKTLYEYPALKAAWEIEQELEKAGLGTLFPSMVPAYEEKTGKGHSEYQSQTEKYGILRASRDVRLNCLERALSALTRDERELVEKKYFNPLRPTDQEVWEAMNVSRGTYHRLKREMLRKLAMMLRLI